VSDEDALLAAVCADPDADLPRLVTADWYDDHGQPERAEFIRLQCEIARAKAGGQRVSCQALERETKLLKRHLRKIHPGYCSADPERGHWVRGFLHMATVSRRFQDALPLIATHPVQQVTLIDRQAVLNIDAVAGLRQLRGLKVDVYRLSVDEARYLATCPHLEAVTEVQVDTMYAIGQRGPIRRLLVNTFGSRVSFGSRCG
jgi:uncharacterized protein (TIGR02996 family)